MEKFVNVLHLISHLKYPLLLIGLYFSFRPIILESEPLEDFNKAFIITGIAISLEALKDNRKLNSLDKKVYHKPKIAKIYFSILLIIFWTTMIYGVYGYFYADSGVLNELSIGLIVLAIGGIGMLKSGIHETINYIEKEKNFNNK